MLTIYKASAGSGKTYTLALDYIKMLLGYRKSPESDRYVLRPLSGKSTAHKNILAVTFTNKATAEMKSRILKELDDLTRIPDHGKCEANYADELMKIFGLKDEAGTELPDARKKLRDAASRALHDLLLDYSHFNVSTIDSFFQSLIRSFAREIDRQGDYRVELDGSTALAQAMSLLFDELTMHPDEESTRIINNWLHQESRDRMNEGEDFNPFNRAGGMYREIIKGIKGIFNETYAAFEEAMADYFSVPARLRLFEEWLDDQINRLLAEEKRATKDLAMLLKGENPIPFSKNPKTFIESVIASKNGIDNESFKKIHNPKDNKPDGVNYIVSMRTRSKSYLIDSKSKYNPSDEAFDIMQAWVKTIDANYPARRIYTLIRKQINALKAINFIHEFLELFRQENNLILISDTNSFLKTIINGSDTPFIYERTGNVLHNFLIDEFQDTSRLQWQNLSPLVGAALHTHDSLIIGDVKQSIYRFRGGDSKILGEQVQKYDFPDVCRVKGEGEGDNRNFRSARDIVRFNNTIFYDLATNPGSTVPGYEGVAQQVVNNDNAWIQVFNLTSKESLQASIATLPPKLAAEVEETSEKKERAAAMRLTATRILDQLDRGYRQSDIAILCFTHNAGTEMAEYLAKNYGDRIRLISPDLLLLRNSHAVKVIISVLELIDRSLEGSSDEDFRADVENATVFKDDKERNKSIENYTDRRRQAALADSFEYFAAKGLSLDDALANAIMVAKNVVPSALDDDIAETEVFSDDEREKTDIAASEITSTLRKIREDGPADLVSLVQSIINRKLTAAERSRELPYITAFVDMVDDFTRDFSPSVHAFLIYWAQNNEWLSIPPGERDDAVTITTIHQAKGLEWPCVHLPLVDWRYDQDPKSGWLRTFTLGRDDKTPQCLLPCPPDIVPPILYMKLEDIFAHPADPFIKQYRAEQTENRSDNVNKAYVAFTRAERELHINIVPRKGSHIGTEILKIIDGPTRADLSTGLYMKLSDFRTPYGLEIGRRPVEKYVRKKKSDQLETIAAPEFQVHFGSLGKRASSISDFITSTDTDITADRQYTPGTWNIDEATRRGKAMHAILQHMLTIDDLDKALEARRRYIKPEEFDEFRNILSTAIKQGGRKVAQWFDPANKRMLTEQSIYCRENDSTVRADRIVWRDDNRVEIIDYKFTTAVKDEHFSQVRTYAYALRRMGYDVRAYLWYPLLNQIESLKDS